MRIWLLALTSCMALGAAEPLAPGKHSKLPCEGSPEDTWDALVPASYGASPTAKAPVLFISGPGGNPGFMGVNAWAEREGVILITINRSKNGPSEPNIAAQAAVIGEAEKRLRLHPCLRFAMGMSGAAQASWLLIGNRPQQSAGLLMMGQCGFDNPWPAKHIAVAYLHGDKEPNLPFIDSFHARLKAAGNPLRRLVVPGGHVSGSAEDRMMLLDWMLTLARLGHPGLTAEERKQGETAFEARITALAGLATAAEREAEAARLMDLPPVQARAALLSKVAAVWRPAVLERAKSASGAAQAAALLPLSTDQRMRGSPEVGQITKLLAELRKDAACKAEFDAWGAWQQVSAQIPGTRGEGAQKKLAETLRELAKRWPDTAGAKAAQSAAAGLGG